MNLLHIENNELRLNTNLDEYTFGKTGHGSIASQEGVLFDGKNFRQWIFEDVKSYNGQKAGSSVSEHLVFYCMKNPLTDEARSLAELLEEGGEAAFKAVIAVCTALTSAAKDGNKIPMVGAGGILVDGSKVLFAPESLYSYAANSLPPQEALTQQNGFLNETISDLPAICFERAVIIYRLLTGRLPFTATDSIARNADIFDHKFLPVEYCVNGIDEELAAIIDNSLRLNSTAVNVPGKRKKGKASEDLRPQAEFPLEKLEEAFKLSQIQAKNGSDKEFEEKVAAYQKSQNSKIKTKRGIKRNSTTIAVIAGILVVILCSTLHTIRTRGEDYTSTGLTSTQTIRAYMNSVNEKDTMILSDFGSGTTPDDFGDMVSRIYVIHKQRLSYGDNGFAYPANWLFYITDESKYARSGVYGVTNLKIDGKAESLKVELKKRNQKPEPLTKEGNVTLQNGSTSVHKVEYYLIYTEGEEADFLTDKIEATITLTYKKNRWIITDIQMQNIPLGTNCAEFKADYFAELEKTGGEVMPAVAALRSKYKWLPEEDAMQREKEQIEYFLTHPYASLGF